MSDPYFEQKATTLRLTVDGKSPNWMHWLLKLTLDQLECEGRLYRGHNNPLFTTELNRLLGEGFPDKLLPYLTGTAELFGSWKGCEYTVSEVVDPVWTFADKEEEATLVVRASQDGLLNEELFEVMSALKPYLALKDNQIVARIVVGDWPMENVIYYQASSDSLVWTYGFQFKQMEDDVCHDDDRHPLRQPNPDGTFFTPSWDYQEILQGRQQVVPKEASPTPLSNALSNERLIAGLMQVFGPKKEN